MPTPLDYAEHAPTPIEHAERPPLVEQLSPNVISVRHWTRLRDGALFAASPRLDWARLLHRTFDVDVLECPTCRGRIRIVGSITDRAAAREILERLGLPAESPRAARARDPTNDEESPPE